MTQKPPASASSCPNTDVQVTGLTQSAMEGSIACLINEQRAASGVVPVAPNAALSRAPCARRYGPESRRAQELVLKILGAEPSYF